MLMNHALLKELTSGLVCHEFIRVIVVSMTSLKLSSSMRMSQGRGARAAAARGVRSQTLGMSAEEYPLGGCQGEAGVWNTDYP